MTKFLMLSAAAVALFSAPAFAGDTTNGHMSPLSGFYVGGYGGYSWNDAESDTFDSGIDGADYGGFVGYKLGWLFDRVDGLGVGMNGAIEASYGSSSADDEVGGVDLEKKDDWSVSFRPGFEVIDQATAPIGIAPYGILGYRNTQFEASTAGADGDERYDGFELGVGTEVIAYGDFGVRVEYAHTWYGEEEDIDIDSDAVRAGVAYHF